MKKEWNKFERWLALNFNTAFKDLNNPASQKQLDTLSSVVSVDLPEDFICFLKIHNGQKGNAGWIIDGAELLSVERIIDEWTVWNDLLVSGDFSGCDEERSNGVKNDWWNPKWIPFTYDGAGNHLCLDLDPAATGHYGQVITMWHDDAERDIKARSFNEWFTQYVKDVEQGQYVYHDDYEAIVNVNDI